MLQLFSFGAIALWLKLAGVQKTALNGGEILSLTANPGFVAFEAKNPQMANTLQQYLKAIAVKNSVREQGIWLQSGPLLLASHQGTVPLPAASLTKIATSLAALKTWGPQHQFETLIGATGAVKHGVLHGNLIIQGGGDPLFIWEEGIALSRSLNRLGIKSVTGNLVIAGNFAMNFNSKANLAGQMLKQSLNPHLWPLALRAELAQKHLLPTAQLPQVVIAGKVSVAKLPITNQILLLRHRSLPLVQLLREMNVYSNNEMAQILADSLGGAPVVAKLAATLANVPQAEIQMVNGSGLGEANRLSPRAICAMLGAIQTQLQSYQLSLADLFAVAGSDHEGTIADRHIPTNTVAKTGTLNQVSALAGVMPSHNRGLVWFVIINHGLGVEDFRTRQDQLLQRLLNQWQGAPILPLALKLHKVADVTKELGNAGRNEILYNN